MYEFKKTNTKVEFFGVKDFDLDHVFDCGQCFRWKKESESSYYGVVGEHFSKVSFEQTDGDEHADAIGNIKIESYENDENFWIRYLDLNRDYGAIKETLSAGDSVMEEATQNGRGIRILRQEVWETLISFIISQNSNIPRIKNCIETLCSEYGEEIGLYRGQKIFTFPKLQTLAEVKEDELKSCRLGYRAKYIAEAARQINRDDGSVLEVASDMNDKEILKYLLHISGIGPKVASCIMLFSMGKLNIFPIDVWVKRVMNRLYNIEENDVDGMKEYAHKHFGKYGGIAQQYLFYYIRNLSLSDPERYEALKIAEDYKKIEI